MMMQKQRGDLEDEDETLLKIDISLQTPSTGLRQPSSNPAIVGYAICLENLSAIEQFFDDTQTAVSL